MAANAQWSHPMRLKKNYKNGKVEQTMKKTVWMGRFAALALTLALLLAGCTTQGVGSGTNSNAPSAPENTGSADTGKTDAPDAASADEPTETAVDFPMLKVQPSGKLKIGLLYHNLETESQFRNYNQTKIECEHRGWELVEGYYTNNDEGRTALTSFITQGVDAIVIGNCDMMPFADLVVQARSKGIGVYNVDNQLVTGVVSNACQPNGVAGAELAYKLAQEYTWDARYAVITNPAIQVQMERTEVAKAIWGQYPGMVAAGEEFVNSQGASESPQQQAYNYAKRFFEKEGAELDIIFCSYDKLAAAADEASRSVQGSNCSIVGIDGGSEAWSHIREEGSNFKYSYAQPTELYNHSTFELIQQLQVDGMQPGDPECMISYFGQAMYFTGFIVDKDNVPDPGQPVHAAFNFYGGDPNDPEAWYNWTGETAPYIIQ